MGLFDRARSRLDELKKSMTRETGPRQFLALADEHRREGRLPEAIETLKTGLGQSPTSVAGHVALGRLLQQAGRLDESLAAYQAALRLDPQNLVAIRQLAEVWLAKGEKVEAIKKLKLFRGLNPGDREVNELIQQLDAELAAPVARGGAFVPQEAPPLPAPEFLTAPLPTAPDRTPLPPVPPVGVAPAPTPVLSVEPGPQEPPAAPLEPGPSPRVEAAVLLPEAPFESRRVEPPPVEEIEAAPPAEPPGLEPLPRPPLPLIPEPGPTAPPESAAAFLEAPFPEPSGASGPFESGERRLDDLAAFEESYLPGLTTGEEGPAPEPASPGPTLETEAVTAEPAQPPPSPSPSVAAAVPAVTETLAELLRAQGHLGDAREAYLELARTEGDGSRARRLLSIAEEITASRGLTPRGRLEAWVEPFARARNRGEADLVLAVKEAVERLGGGAAVVTDLEGVPVVTAGPRAEAEAMETLTAELTAFWKNVRRSRAEIGEGALDSLVLTGTEGAAAVKAITPSYALLLKAGPGVPVARLRFEAARAAEQLRPALL